MPKTIALILAATIAVAATSCEADPIAGQDRSVYVVGDSIVASAAWNNDERFAVPAPDGYTVKVDAFMGQTAADHLEQVRTYAADNVPERLVIELGTNDARNDGWTTSDVDTYRALVDAAPDRTCITFVLPAAGAGATRFERTEIDRAAASIRRIAADEPRHAVADFADFLLEHPELLADDGIHLVTDGPDGQAAKDAYRDWLWSFVTDCAGAPA